MRAELVERVLDEVRAGRRVAVVAPSRNLARQAFGEVSERIAEGEQARRAVGAERVESGAGRVDFTIPGALRGWTVDVVVLVEDAPRTVDVDVLAQAGAEVVR